MPVTRIKNNVVTDNNIAPSKLAVTTAMQTFLGNATSANLAAAVSSNTGSGDLVFAASPTLTNPIFSGNITTNTSQFVLNQSNGRVGIGTASPQRLLHINGAGARLRIQSTNADSPVLELAGPSFTNFLFADTSVGSWYMRTDSSSRHVWIQSMGAQVGASVQGNTQIGGITGPMPNPSSTLVVQSNTNSATVGVLDIRSFSGTTVAAINASGQTVVGNNTLDESAQLQVNSTTRGFLPPRMTISQRNAIASPAAGLTVYTTDGFNMSYHNGTSWGDVFSSHSSSFTSDTLRNAVSDETGTGRLVFNAAPTFVGPVNITGQDASDGARAMTRDLFIPEISQGLWIPLSWNTPTGTANTTSSNAGIAFNLSIQGTAVAGNNRVCTVYRNPLNRAGSGANMVFSQAKWSIVASLQANGISNNELRLLIGTAPTATELTASGVAVVWNGFNSVKLQIHNGSTILESSNFTIPQNMASDRLHRFLVNFNGSSLRLFSQSYGDSVALPRWSFIGELTRSGLPSVTSGTSIILAAVATGTPAFNLSYNMDAMFFAPYVVTP
jgi:hypothetical protein